MAFPTQIDSAGAGQFACALDGADGSMNAGFPGAFSDGLLDRYEIIADLTAFKLRCYKSSDAGASFAEQDAAHAPSIANDIGSPHPGTFQLWHSCIDQANKIIYTVFWSTAFTLAIKPFKIGTGWQATVDSGIGYAFASNFDRAGADLCCEFRPATNDVWASHEDLNAGGATACEVFGLKFACGTSTWDVATTLLAGAGGDGLVWHIAGMRRDSTGALHLFGDNYKDSTPNNAQTWQLWHRVIHADNSLSATQIVQSKGWDGSHVQEFTDISVPFISSSDKISLTFQNGPAGLPVSPPNGAYVMRGQAGDAPAWTIENPAPLQLPLNNGGLAALKGTITLAGVDYAFYAYLTAGGTSATYAYITDSGSGWGAENIIGTFDDSGASFFVSNALIPVVVGNGGWAFTFGLLPVPPNVNGVGFWGGVAAAGAVAPPKSPLMAVIPFPIKRCLTPRRTMGARPELVHCIMPSPDGKLYVPVKGPLINRECC